MKTLKSFLCAGVALAALSGASAYAADMAPKGPYVKAPMFKPAPVYNWTGFYLGVNAGVGASQSTSSIFIPPDLSFADRGGKGFAGGVQGGFNWQFAPQLVAGVEGDIGYLGINRSLQDWNENFALGVKTDWYGTLRGRLGYTSGPSLFYVTGGAAFVKVKNNFDGIPPNVLVSKSETATGWTAGAGIETMLGGNWSAKAEYLYIDAGGQDIINPSFGLFSDHFDNRFHVYRYGVNYKFGGPAGASAMPVYNWAGLYIGVNGGMALSQDAITAPGLTPTRGTSVDITKAGAVGGAQVGYNWQFSPTWVAGLEGDIGYLGINRSFGNFNDPNAVFGVKTDWYGTLRGRVGYSTGPALLYVTGGAAFVNVRNSFDFKGVTLSSKSETKTGWTAGGGIEATLAQNWTAKTEYLYIDAGSQDVFNSQIGPLGTTAHFDNRFHVFRFGLNYAFGH